MRGLITNIDSEKKLIEGILAKRGYSSEHNYWQHKNMEEEGIKLCFYTNDKKEGIALIYYEEEKDWEIASEVLADDKVGMIFEFAAKAFAEGCNKFFVSTTPEERKGVLRLAKEKGYTVSRPVREFVTPYFDLNEFDEKLEGKDWKKIRNKRNALVKNNKVEFKDCAGLDKKKLLKLVDDWGKTRRSSVAKAWMQTFKNFVINDFKGCDVTRAVVVNDEICSLAAGWKIPNTDVYYSSIGIHNYKYNGLGEVAYIDELSELKKKGYRKIDLGGSEKRLLEFKKKFKPSEYSKVLFYWIKNK